MQKLKVILHIGTEKTGTTSIQKFLGINRDKITEDCILLSSGLINNYNNIELVLASDEQPGADISNHRTTGFEAFRQQVKLDILEKSQTNHTMFFSSEHLSSRLVSNETVQALKDLFPENTDFQIIIYLKPQDQLYLGSFAEAMKAGIPYDKIVKMNDVMKRERYGSEYYDYKKLLSRWCDVFGLQSIKVRPFSKVYFENGNLLEDFYKLISTNSKGLNFSLEKSNKSLSPECLIFLSDICERYPAIPRYKVISLLETIDPFESGGFFNKVDVNCFFEQFTASNTWVLQMFLSLDNSIFKASNDEKRVIDLSDYTEISERKKILINMFDNYI
jgi:hypothetical protein